MRVFWAGLWAVLALAAPPLWAEGCHEQVACVLAGGAHDGRSYHVKEPDGWDGQTPLPVLLHFHGWQRQGTLIVRHRRISGATRRRGVLLLAPNGRGRSWDFWDAGTADVGFAEAVLADAATRWPIDRSRVYVSGYSFGGAMAWRFACAAGDSITALLAIGGTLSDQGEACATGPVEVRHVHGLRDRVMDYPFGPAGEVTWPVKLWRDKNGCAGPPDTIFDWAVTRHDTFQRHVWRDCASGRPVFLDVHNRGHFIPRGWIGQQLDELLAAPS